jgi:hypothetical protein
MRFVVMATVVLAMGLAVPAAAQDRATAHRLELAQRLVELSNGDSFEKLVEQQIQAQMAELGDAPSPEADWMQANVPQMAMQMIHRMMPELAALYADIFSEAELQAQITLYESPVGRSIANKSVQLGMRQQAILAEAMAAYMQEFASKFCARFDCSAAAAGKARSR